jgi:hypothetical protein
MESKEAKDPSPSERTKVADRLDRSARHLLLAIIPTALIPAVDLPTGWLTGDRRIDIALLAAVAMALWRAYSLRRLARRLRSGEVARRPTRRRWVLSLASMAPPLALSAGIGYLIGGWVPALVVPSATIVLMAGSAAIGIRRRRRIH